MISKVGSSRTADRLVISLTRLWCFARHPFVCWHTYKDSRVLPDPAMPVTYVDKFLWRKLFDHNPLFTLACDKLASKAYALSVCPELKTAKVLWSGTDTALIPPDILAGNVVVKANHGCRWNIMIRNGEVDRPKLYRRTSRWVRRRFGKRFGEWAYKNAVRSILVEEMLMDRGEPIGTEYKFHVSGGVTEYVYAASRNNQGEERKGHYRRDGRYISPSVDSGAAWVEVPLPEAFSHMCEIAEQLTAPFDRMRCDLYELGGEIFFSEFAVYPLSGKGITNVELRDLSRHSWDLRQSWFMNAPQKGWRRLYASALRRRLEEAQPEAGSGDLQQAPGAIG